MKFIEPTFNPAGGAWPLPSNTHQKDISDLENKITKQSSELNLRLTEVLELYNLQSRHANELDTAHEEISRLQRIISALHRDVKQQKTDAATAQDKVTGLENDKAVLRAQLNQALQDSKSLAGRLHAVQTAFDARETNATSAFEQVDYLNSELANSTAERFKLVASIHGEKRRHNLQTSALEERIKKAESKVEKQEMQIKGLEAVRCKLDKRIQVLEALLKSEHEIAERRTKRLTDVP
jgi:chromosome segregation ATPase